MTDKFKIEPAATEEEIAEQQEQEEQENRDIEDKKKRKGETKNAANRSFLFIAGGAAFICAIVFFMWQMSSKKHQQLTAERSTVQSVNLSSATENNTPPDGLSGQLEAAEKAQADKAKASGNSFVSAGIGQRVTDVEKEKARQDEEARRQASENLQAQASENYARQHPSSPEARALTASTVGEVSNFSPPTNGNSSLSINFQEERYVQYGKIANDERTRTEKDLNAPAETEIVVIQNKNPLQNSVVAASGVPQAVQDIADGKALLGKMGDRYYAQLDAGVKSDLTSPVIATIISGPARSTRISGSFARAQDGTMLLNFNKLAVGDGRSLALSAVAIDQKSGIAAVNGDINHMFAERFLLPMTAAVFGQYGQLQAQNGTTTTLPANALQGQQVVRTLSPSQLRAGALGAVATQAQTILTAEAALAKPTTTLNQNLMIMIMLTDDLFITNKGIVKNGSISKSN